MDLFDSVYAAMRIDPLSANQAMICVNGIYQTLKVTHSKAKLQLLKPWWERNFSRRNLGNYRSVCRIIRELITTSTEEMKSFFLNKGIWLLTGGGGCA